MPFLQQTENSLLYSWQISLQILDLGINDKYMLKCFVGLQAFYQVINYEDLVLEFLQGVLAVKKETLPDEMQ